MTSIDIPSAWRVLPDLQVGLAHIASDARRQALLGLVNTVATTAVGISPAFDDLADTAQALRYARFALNATDESAARVVVFDDTLLGIMAVSAPELTAKAKAMILNRFDTIPGDEKELLFETFRVWIDHEGSADRAGEVLYCHANTVRHRLRRIEELSGRSLKIPRQLAELCVAIEIEQWVR